MSNPAGDALTGASALASQVPAYIQVHPPGVGLVNFSYNPDELSLSSHAEWHATPQPGATSGAGSPQYQGSHSQSMTVTILLDTFTVPPNPPTVAIEMLKQCLSPGMIPMPGGGREPPHVTFGWGPNIVMADAYVTSLTINYKRFLLGIPVRAEVHVGLQAVPSILPFTNPTSGGLATRRSHTVVEGDTLASVAYQEYGDPTKWRALAAFNDIDDPMRLTPGTVLIVPERREAEALA